MSWQCAWPSPSHLIIGGREGLFGARERSLYSAHIRDGLSGLCLCDEKRSHPTVTEISYPSVGTTKRIKVSK
jgi:hypothetical protein